MLSSAKKTGAHVKAEDEKNNVVPSCPGSRHVMEYERTWYIPNGKQASEFTVCEACFKKYIVSTGSEKDFYSRSCLYGCSCDFTKPEDSENSMTKNDIRFSLVDVRTHNTFPMEKVSDSKAIIKIPTGKQFMIYGQKMCSDPHVSMTMEECSVDEKSSILYEPNMYVGNAFEIYGYFNGNNFFPTKSCRILLIVQKWKGANVSICDEHCCCFNGRQSCWGIAPEHDKYNVGSQGQIVVSKVNGVTQIGTPDYHLFECEQTKFGEPISFEINVVYE
jgi:hypothetical protein